MDQTMMINQNSIIIRKNNNINSIYLDGEIAMMDTEKGKYYGLDSVASRIWELLSEPKTFKELIDLLTNEYDISRSECEEDVSEFLHKLLGVGLVTCK